MSSSDKKSDVKSTVKSVVLYPSASNYLFGSMQAVTAGVNTQVIFPEATDVLVGFPRTSTDGYVIPLCGTYVVKANIYVPLSITTTVIVFWTKNDNNPTTSKSNFLGLNRVTSTSDVCLETADVLECAQGDILRPWLVVTKGVSLGSMTDRSRVSSLRINRLHG
jgi:hypothetical protein